MKRRTSMLLVVFGVSLLLAVVPTWAHEGREVGEYLLEFGWRHEPAYAGQLNGPEVLVALHDAHDEALPEDIALALQTEVTFGDQALTLTLEPAYGESGHYVADLIPTLAGDYSFRVFGTIGAVAVDETFSSADGEFSTVEPLEDVLFPVIENDAEARIRALEARIAELEARLAALEAG
jgi:hypothetical protein